MKTKSSEKNLKLGFTLLELLVVVLIIGILAAIALPQYKLSVGKAKYSTLKTITRNIADAVTRYNLANNTAPNSAADLDIDLQASNENSNTVVLEFDLTNYGIHIIIWKKNSSLFIASQQFIYGKKMRFYMNKVDRSCLVYSVDTDDIVNRICQNETGLRPDQAGCSDDYCTYHYPASRS